MLARAHEPEPPAERLAHSGPKRVHRARRPSERATRPGELLGQNGETEGKDDDAGAGYGYDEEDEPEQQDAEAGNSDGNPADLEREPSRCPRQVSRSKNHPIDTSITCFLSATPGVRHDFDTKQSSARTIKGTGASDTFASAAIVAST